MNSLEREKLYCLQKAVGRIQQHKKNDAADIKKCRKRKEYGVEWEAKRGNQKAWRVQACASCDDCPEFFQNPVE
ncbi:MAG: hypothetical protein NC123_08115 [Butyrivibrio sp.]|nr:hypothetical protein [Acetatifactor muris]MCM1559496.1 hypothetical protein [Butyrivibrio sp.]